MKKVILDTNFILSCLRRKIDFFEEIENFGLGVLVPKEVVEELNRITFSKKKKYFRDAAALSLKLLEKNKFEFVEVGGSYVDKGLVNFLKKNPEVILASLDRNLRGKVSNRKMIIRNKKKLIVE